MSQSENYFPFYHGIRFKDLIKDCALIPFLRMLFYYALFNSYAAEQRKTL